MEIRTLLSLYMKIWASMSPYMKRKTSLNPYTEMLHATECIYGNKGVL